MPTLLVARTALRERLSEATAAAWTDTELNRWINEGVRDIAIRSECLATMDDLSVVATQYQVAPGAEALRVHRAEWINADPPGGTDQVYPLLYSQINNMDHMWGSGQTTSSGIPNVFSTWGYPGTNSFKLILYPRPQTDGTLRIWYYRLPTDAVNDGNSLDLPNGWDHLVYDYAEYRAKVKDGDDSWQIAKTDYEGRLEMFAKQFARLTDENDQIGVDAGYWANYLSAGDEWSWY